MSDPDTLALASQTLEPVLSALLDPNRLVLRVTCEGTQRSYRVRHTDEAALAHLLALARFLLEHRQQAAFYVLASTLKRLNPAVDDPHMDDLLRACGESIQRIEGLDATTVNWVQNFAAQYAHTHTVSRDVLTMLFTSSPTSGGLSPTQVTRNAWLGALHASPEQCRQVQDHPGLRDAIDRLLSADPPLLAVFTDERGQLGCSVPQRENAGGHFDQACWVARELLKLKIPGAAYLLGALLMAARGHPHTESDLIGPCAQAFLHAPVGISAAFLSELSQRACQLAESGALKLERLSELEWAARYHRAPDCQVLLRRQRLWLELQQMQALTDPQQRNTLADLLKNDILAAHRLMREQDPNNGDAIELMRSLYELGLKHAAPWTDSVQQALEGLILVRPQ